MRYSSGEDGVGVCAPLRLELIDEQSDGSIGRISPGHIAKAVLSGHFNYADMDSDYITSVIWIIANHQPRDQNEKLVFNPSMNEYLADLNSAVV